MQLGILNAFCGLLIFFKINFFKKLFQEYHQSVNLSNSLGPDQARHFLMGLILVETVCTGNHCPDNIYGTEGDTDGWTSLPIYLVVYKWMVKVVTTWGHGRMKI